MRKNNLIDGIIKEPLGGAHTNPDEIFQKVKDEILSQLTDLEKLDPKKRITARIKKFCDMGVVIEG